MSPDPLGCRPPSTLRRGSAFTHRELQVLILVAKGMNTTAIATNLRLSQNTVKHVIGKALSRLGLRNRAHLVAYAFRNGVDLIDLGNERV
ncbi:response regulator transcription factor [Streptomyces buecherae]|uniref:response regulator transcription factor n=1 Tax=Streptomyces buecherae TaxID=2763006 RepID=UPI0022B7B045|nr:helix-turn-helix transcriptional regulator [Streptomyces buecherae]